MSQPRLLYFGFFVPESQADHIFAGEEHPQISALRFQRNLLGALESAGASIEAITTPPIASFPRNRHWRVPGGDYAMPGLRLSAYQISSLNLPGLRMVMRLAQWVRHGIARLAQTCDGILVYSVHSPMVAAALLLKVFRRVPVFVFIPDVPTFMGGRSTALKRILKHVDARIVRRMLAWADGTFPVTDATGRDWLLPGTPYWAMEGISDDAAAVLESARANGSFVFRGSANPPRLLYTGALAYLLPFVRAFHQSSIDASITFMGGGEDLEALQGLAARDARIRVKPFATGAALAREVDQADFLLNPRDPAWQGSAYSFPWKLFEYLRYGKPIISTRLSGVAPAYFGVFRPIELSDQAAFEESLRAALQADNDPGSRWSAAERLADRLRSRSVGPRLLSKIAEWSA